MILDRIVAETRRRLPAQKAVVPLAAMEAQAAQVPPPRDLKAALRAPGVSLIAEVKRASPSRGWLAPDLDPVDVASIYAEHGAAALSVLTDEPFFRGRLGYLDDIRMGLGAHCPPLLRKDFHLEPYQLYEARVHGADGVLLIVAILDDALLRALLQLAHGLGLAALVEVHDEPELDAALAAGAQVIGINNRDLNTFEVDLDTTARLRARIPSEILVVSESGYHVAADVRRAAAYGVDAILVGESLVTAPDVAAQTRMMVQAGQKESDHG